MRANTLKTLFLLVCLVSVQYAGYAQQNEHYARMQAMNYADSLVSAFQQHDSQQYIRISHPGLVHYYGGRRQFLQFLDRSYRLSAVSSKIELELAQLKRENNEWQSLIKQSKITQTDGSTITVVTYLAGQSKDNGRTWKYADLGNNSGENIRYIMPDIFDDMELAAQQLIHTQMELARQ